jgi:hypothetical protein
MAVGDAKDTLARLKALLPASWFRDKSDEVSALLAGAADGEAFDYALTQYAKAQTRLQTTTDGFLDLAAWDFFGVRFTRRKGENDALFLARILAEIVRERATRKGLSQAIADVTGRVPKIIEPWNPNDTAAYGKNAYYGQAGYYGSLSLPYQVFVNAYRPLGAGIPNIPGYGYGFYSANAWYINLSQVAGDVVDADIFAAADAARAAGVIVWMRITDGPSALFGDDWSYDFSNDWS